MHHGDSKDFSPSNAWNDSKTAVLRQLPRPAAAVPVITRGQRQCRYTEWVSVGIQTVPRGSGHCPNGLASVQVSTRQNARLHSALYKVALAGVQVCTTANANLSRCGSSLALRQLQTCTSHSPWGRHKRRFCVNCRSRSTGTRCPTLRAKTQIPHRVCKHGAEFDSPMRCSSRQRTFTLFSQSISGARSSSFGQTTVPRSTRARLK